MDNGQITSEKLEEKIKLAFENYYQRAKDMEYIHKPYSWALYNTWKMANRIEKPR